MLDSVIRAADTHAALFHVGLSNHFVDVKDRAATQHAVHGASQFSGQQTVGPGGRMLLFDSIAECFGLRRLTLEQWDGFTERPLQVSIADLAAR